MLRCHLLRATLELAYFHPANRTFYQRLYGELHTAPPFEISHGPPCCFHLIWRLPGDRGAVVAHIEATNSAFIVIGTQNLLAEQWVPLFADLQDIKSQFIRDLFLNAFGEVRLEDLLGRGVDEAFALFNWAKCCSSKPPATLCVTSSPAGGCLLLPDVEQCSAFCSSQNPSPVSARRAYPGGIARAVVQIAQQAMQRVANLRTVVKQATVTLLITRQHMKQQGFVRRALLAFTPDGDVGNCLLQGFTGSH